ncbi:histidine phosphatase family protein [Shewanella sp. UCD-KL12]|uniref:histidine phosphatase family protein n=1 Tax=Shewanella sp. UCD-KL12 TaxID=1917163 RepID=UPI0009FAD343|nr:histidine phosphatase family protein [Shewanella sp. UCD-KL12]
MASDKTNEAGFSDSSLDSEASEKQTGTGVDVEGVDKESTTVFYLLRHGECEGGKILRGHTDVAGSQTGRAQMQSSVDHLITSHNLEFEQIFSSPLRRCSEFALSLYLQLGAPLKLEEGFKEINFGDWDGETLASLYETQASQIEQYWKNPWAITPPNGETMHEFESRVDASWQSILSEHQGKTVLVVTHGGVMRHLMARALGVSGVAGFYTQLALDYASVVKITVYTSPEGSYYPQLHW